MNVRCPYWCPDRRSYFSVRTGTVLASTKVAFKKSAFAVYLTLTNLKGLSSMKLHRDIGVSQPTAWFMLQRLVSGVAVMDAEKIIRVTSLFVNPVL